MELSLVCLVYFLHLIQARLPVDIVKSICARNNTLVCLDNSLWRSHCMRHPTLNGGEITEGPTRSGAVCYVGSAKQNVIVDILEGSSDADDLRVINVFPMNSDLLGLAPLISQDGRLEYMLMSDVRDAYKKVLFITATPRALSHHRVRRHFRSTDVFGALTFDGDKVKMKFADDPTSDGGGGDAGKDSTTATTGKEEEIKSTTGKEEENKSTTGKAEGNKSTTTTPDGGKTEVDEDETTIYDGELRTTTEANTTGTNTTTTTTTEQPLENPNEELGKSLVVLQADQMLCTFQECNFGNLAADAFVKYVAHYTDITTGRRTIYWSNATIGLADGRMFVKTIDPRKGNQTITKGELYGALKGNEYLYIFWLKGAHLMAVLEQGLKVSELENFYGFLQLSGIQLEYDPNKPVGHRVHNVLVRSQDEHDVRYEQLNESTTWNYKLVGPESFVYKSRGDRALTLKKANKFIKLQNKSIDVIAWYIKTYQPITIGYENRIRVVITEQLAKSDTTQAVPVLFWIIMSFAHHLM